MIRDAEILICPKCSNLAIAHPDESIKVGCPNCQKCLDRKKDIGGKISLFYSSVEEYANLYEDEEEHILRW